MRCPNELRELLMQLVDPDGEPVDYVRLANILRDDPNARRYYRQFMEIHARLDLIHDTPLCMPELQIPGGPPVSDTSIVSTNNSSSPIAIPTTDPTLPAWRSYLTPPAFIGFLCGFLALLIPLSVIWVVNQTTRSSDPSKIAATDTGLLNLSSPTIGRITYLSDCVWHGKPQELDARLVSGGSIDINSGNVEIMMANGAFVTIEGPASFTLETSGSGYLHHGQIACSVPENDDGFTVLTPSATVVDLGTEFGVWVNEEGVTETYVRSGMVGFQPRSDEMEESTGQVSLLTTQQCARIAPGPNAKAEPVAFQSERFTSLPSSDYTIAAHPSGGLLYSNGQGTLFGGHSNSGTRRVGVSGSLSAHFNGRSRYLRLSNAFLFRLPRLRSDTQIKQSRLEFTYAYPSGKPNFSIDLYGLGYMNLKAFRKDWHFEGKLDKSSRFDYGLGGKDKSIQLISKHILNPDSSTGRIVVEGEELSKFLQSVYADGAKDGDVVVFRLNIAEGGKLNTPQTGYNIIHSPVIMGKTSEEDLPILHLDVIREGNSES